MVITAILGLLVLREALGATQILGVLLVAIGVALVSSGTAP